MARLIMVVHCVFITKKNYDKFWEDVQQAQRLVCQVEPEFLTLLRRVSGRDK